VTHTPTTLLLLAGLLSVLVAPSEGGATKGEPSPEPIRYGQGRQLCELANGEINESSGLACSRRTPGVFWTHNDSGDSPRLFAFDAKGHTLAILAVAGAIHRDWEDMASFTLGGKPCLLIADIGDNSAWRSDCTLYIVPEPRVDPTKRDVRLEQQVAIAVDFEYDDGPRDCEAVAIDPTTRTIYLVSKTPAPECTVYALPLPKRTVRENLKARPIATLSIPMVSAMDISPDGLRAIIATYGNAYEYTRRADEKWAQAFARGPRTVALPRRRQGESIAYGPDGKTLYLTSEQTPTPLLEVPVAEPK